MSRGYLNFTFYYINHNITYMKNIKNYLQKLIQKQDLGEQEASDITEKLVNGELQVEQTAAFLVALAAKGESIDEMVGMVSVLRDNMIQIEGVDYALDTCGTGGDCSNTINVSTIVAFVCAAAGVPVAKHGNRSISSNCGSFDVLEQLGAKINLTAVQAKACLDQTSITCLFAPNFHPTFKHIMPVRKALGVRTIFNFLGPLLHPANATHQLIGVSSKEMAKKLGKILMRLGSKKVILVHSEDGLDEISISVPTYVYEYSQGKEPKSYSIKPGKLFSLDEIRGGDAKENAKIMQNILANKGTEAQNEMIIMNAGMALFAANAVDNFEAGKEKAKEIIKSGAGLKKLEKFIKVSNEV